MQQNVSATLPVIDLTRLHNGSDEVFEEVATEISSACALSGFFYVSGHGIPEEAVDALRETSRQFFSQSDGHKRQIAINQHNRGYLGPGEARMRGAAKTDMKEVFFWGRDLPADDPDVVAGIPLCGPNLWPDAPAGFREHVVAYAEAVGRAGDLLLQAIAVSLGAERSFFTSRYERPMLRGQLIHYPPLPEDAPADQFGVAPHSDFGCITLLLQQTAGLEVLAKNDEWIAAPPFPGTLVINIGDLLERWSNNRLPSTRHRVRNQSRDGRYSIAMFYDPSPRAVVDPLDLGAPEPAAFAPVEAAEYVLGRNKGAFAHYDPAIKEPA
ncbi:MAG: isopenicillin N synthase family oxygenase [Alphaproteobacteria bacterium]|nr:isopenicillin N synthase family oxygenase [Alphaproteobacteria bacterium]